MITETVAMAVTSQMIAIWLEEVTGTDGKRRWSPWLIWTVPRPRVIEMPSMVANTLNRKLVGHMEEADKVPEHIHEVSKPAKNPVANQRKETGLHGKGQVLLVGHQAQKKTNKGINHPSV